MAAPPVQIAAAGPTPARRIEGPAASSAEGAPDHAGSHRLPARPRPASGSASYDDSSGDASYACVWRFSYACASFPIPSSLLGSLHGRGPTAQNQLATVSGVSCGSSTMAFNSLLGLNTGT